MKYQLLTNFFLSRLILKIVLLAIFTIYFSSNLFAEPYLAVRSGLKCLSCHVNPTGGGKRTTFGNIYAKTSLATEQLITDNPTLDGDINDYFSLGADLRFNLTATKIDQQADSFAFELQRTSVYLETTLIPNRLSFYIDERIAPGAALSREVYALYRSKDSHFYSKVGRFFLPLGIRLEDDSAFIKTVTGINFNNSDTGVEFGFEYPSWSNVVAISNGTNGGTENNEQKQFSFRSEYFASNWRLGISYNLNAAANNENREIVNIFSGVSLWGVDWLFEVDSVNDKSVSPNNEQLAYLIEANIEVAKGHNVKISYDFLDPDTTINQDQQTRSSLLWEISPFEFTQLRSGVRVYDGIPQNSIQNRQELFVQLHNYF